ncbi:MAG: hypothetical protein QM757_46105 [Paludibaculum sp.]
MAQAEQEFTFAHEKLSAAANEAVRKQAASQVLQAEWAALWEPWGVTASGPSQMAEWLRRRAGLAERARELDLMRLEIEKSVAQEEAAAEELRQAILLVTGAVLGPGSSPAMLRGQAAALLEEQKES